VCETASQTESDKECEVVCETASQTESDKGVVCEQRLKLSLTREWKVCETASQTESDKE
jgi:hypothetical protein